jgi:hypothetical protein
MNTKIRIGIWIVAFFLVFSGLGLSSRKAFAASGFAIQRSAFISVYPGYAMATVYAGIPSGAALVLHNALRDIAPTSLSVNEIDEFRLINAYSLKAITPQFAVLSSGAALVLHNALRDVTPISLSVNEIDEFRLINAYSLKAITPQFAVLPSGAALVLHNALRDVTPISLSVNEIDEFRQINAYRLKANTPTLSAADVSGYSSQLRARSSAGLSSSVALSTNNNDESRLLDNYRWQAIERFYGSYGGR